jgi:hypothetical protein
MRGESASTVGAGVGSQSEVDASAYERKRSGCQALGGADAAEQCAPPTLERVATSELQRNPVALIAEV